MTLLVECALNGELGSAAVLVDKGNTEIQLGTMDNSGSVIDVLPPELLCSLASVRPLMSNLGKEHVRGTTRGAVTPGGVAACDRAGAKISLRWDRADVA